MSKPSTNAVSLSLMSGIRAAMSRNPDKVAIEDSRGSRTYSELVARADRITSALIGDLKLNDGAHAAIVSSDSIEYVEIVAGASQAGVALATINPLLSSNEIIAICDNSQASVLFSDSANADRLRACDFAAAVRIIELGEESEAWLASVNGSCAIPDVSEHSVFTIPYTSGTTGDPKGVLVSHRSRVLTMYAMAAEYGCYSSDDRFLAIAPLCHGAGMVFALASLFFGGYVRLTNRFDPETVLSILHNENITGVFMVPTHFHRIFELDDTILDQYKGTRLHAIVSNAAPLPNRTKEKILQYFGNNLLHETYGSTEASIVSNLRPADQLRKRNCVGLPISSTLLHIRNENGQECGPEEPGELFSSSPYLFNGYWENPSETKAVLQNGWVSVGDIVKRDADGYLYIIDRKKDMIISGGTNIYPREIEVVLEQHPAILAAAVIGIPDQKWGERLKAYVVIDADIEFVSIEVISFAESLLAKYKVPKEFEAIDELPRNAGGKLVKESLRALHQSSN